jgi:hypothetical protein
MLEKKLKIRGVGIGCTISAQRGFLLATSCAFSLCTPTPDDSLVCLSWRFFGIAICHNYFKRMTDLKTMRGVASEIVPSQ